MAAKAKSRLRKITPFDVILCAIFIVFSYITFYPFLMVVFGSISDPIEMLKNPLFLYPRSINFITYQVVFNDPSIIRSFANSFFYSFSYTFILIIFTTAAAYSLSVKTFAARKLLIKFFLVPMFFSGGLLPSYMLISKLGMINTVWAIILPGCVSCFNLILVRTFIEQLPQELMESAFIDGATDIHIFYSIILPLSIPIMATIGLWAFVGQWNSYFGPLIYFNDSKKFPLQVVLRELLQTAQINEMSMNAESMFKGESIVAMKKALKSESLRSAIIVVSSVPVLIIYPFVQRYFVKGIMIGSIKG